VLDHRESDDRVERPTAVHQIGEATHVELEGFADPRLGFVYVDADAACDTVAGGVEERALVASHVDDRRAGPDERQCPPDALPLQLTIERLHEMLASQP
jgi:hypothetical protein